MIGASAVATASAMVGALVVLPPSQSEQMPWWERARRTYPCRLAPVVTVFVIAQIVSAMIGFYFGILQFPAPPQWFVGAALTSVLGPTAVAMLMAWMGTPRNRPISHWLAGCLNAMLFRVPNTLIYAALAAALYLLPHDLPTALVVLILGAGGMGLAAWGGGVWVAWILGLARLALPRAAHAANWAGERVGVRAAATFELLWPIVRVDAFIFSRYLVVTDAAATLLSNEELLALSIREMTFFQQPWLTGTLRVTDSAVIFFMLACTAVGAILGGHALLVGTGVGFGSAILIRPFIRRAQIKADALAAGAAIEPTSALRAMERQFELNLQPVVAISNRSRDAHLYDRMTAAGIPPTYPRPAPPSKGRIVLSIAAAAGTCVALSIVFLVIVAFAAGM